MAHPGMAFVIVVGVGLATLLYYMFNDNNNNNNNSSNNHTPHGNSNGGVPPNPQNSWSTASNRSKSKRKDSNSDCTGNACCPICLVDLIVGNIVVTFCGHSFHKKCMQEWQQQTEMLNHNQCPVCRAKIRMIPN